MIFEMVPLKNQVSIFKATLVHQEYNSTAKTNMIHCDKVVKTAFVLICCRLHEQKLE